jgi:hypothetical protein
MKKFYPFFNLIILAASLCLLSCQKQLRWPDEPVTLIPPLIAETNCKPAVLGIYAEGSGASWATVAQKWYINSKVSYVKTLIGAAPAFAGAGDMEPALKLDWGQLFYETNQVYLRDVQHNNEIVMRVTIDDEGRAAASYYYNQTRNADNAFQYDTTYYYYTGKRLDSTISIYQTLLTAGAPPVNAWNKYKFTYDIYGNISKIEGYPNLLRLNFKYDYHKPVAGIISNYHLTMPMKLMEFMELVKLPMRHALSSIELGQYSAPPVADNFIVLVRQQYEDYQINRSGLVYSYVLRNGNNKYTLHNGWECGMVNSPMNGGGRQQGIVSLDEFKQLYPFTK